MESVIITGGKCAIARRVSYGKADTPLDKREYNIDGFGPSVGCVDEIIHHLRRYAYRTLVTYDIDGKRVYDVESGELKIADVKAPKKTRKPRIMHGKRGVYYTIDGNACEYTGGNTAHDLDADCTIPVECVDFKRYIRAIE